MLEFATIGIGGYGATHLTSIEKLKAEGAASLSAIAEVNYEGNKERIETLRSQGVKYYSDWHQMLDFEKGLDAVTIATPLHLHRDMVVEALRKGYNVICEKSAATTIQDVDAMIRAQKESGKLCAIHFQLLTGAPFRRLKELLFNGPLGRPKTLVGIGLCQRQDSYFARSRWSGKFMLDGKYVLDGPINNAVAHIFNNLLSLACESPYEIAEPEEVRAELYRAHPQIETEDTASIHVRTATGADVFFYPTYCAHKPRNPWIEVEAENGKATWNNYSLKVEYNNGEVEEVSSTAGEEGTSYNIFRNMVDVLSGRTEELFSALPESKKLVKAQNGAYYSSGKVFLIPGEYVTRVEEKNSVSTYVKDLDEIILRAASEKKLFSEIGIPWARSTQAFSLKDYERFELKEL